MSFNRQHKKIAFLSLGIFALFVFASIFTLNLAEKVSGATGGGSGGLGGGSGDGQAGTVCPLSGWAWSGYQPVDSGRPSGIGWMSFNSADPGASGGPYRVEMQSNGNLTGYAWASPGKDGGGNDSIGWVNFDPAGPFPAGPNYSARVNLTSGSSDFGKITGWARACVVFQSGCSGTLKSNTERGGWDGWISLSGTANNDSPYGVQWSSTNNRFEGHAWGGNQVIGWLSFAGGNYEVTITDSVCRSILNNGGGAGFNYQVFVQDFSLPSGTAGNIDDYLVEITMLSGNNPEEVQLIEIVPAERCDLNDCIKAKIDPVNNNCTPGGSNNNCYTNIDIEYNLGDGQTRGFQFNVQARSSSGVLRQGTLNITALASGAASCAPSRSFTVIGQTVEWSVDPSDLVNPSYEWSGDENLSGQTQTISKTYTSAGLKRARVTITHDEGERVVECSPNLQVFSEFEFEHL